MKLRTKLKLKFYLSLMILILFTVVTGIVFEYVVWLGWKQQLGLSVVPYEHFMAMAIILLIMSVSDIVLFFRLILKRQYW